MKLTLINLLSGVEIDVIDVEFEDDGIYGHELDDNNPLHGPKEFYPYSIWAVI